ncbi:MAG: helix-turn-helix domain-containing protein [Promethearchaeota archaeon]
MLLKRKIRITSTTEQAQVLWVLSEKCRLLYNFALAERRNHGATVHSKPEAQRNRSPIPNNKTPCLPLKHNTQNTPESTPKYFK